MVVARLQVSASPPRAVSRPLQLGPGADVHVAHPMMLRGQMPFEVPHHHCDVRVVAIRYAEALLGGGVGATFGTAFATAPAGAAGRTGGTLGGGGRGIIPSTGSCPATHRRHASTNFSRSPAMVHRELENARSQGAMALAMTRRKASPP